MRNARVSREINPLSIQGIRLLLYKYAGIVAAAENQYR